jgi:hypothetical protein
MRLELPFSEGVDDSFLFVSFFFLFFMDRVLLCMYGVHFY